MSTTELLLLSKIAEVSGKNAKRDLLQSAVSDVRMQQLLDAAFNYKRKFYIKKWDTVLSDLDIQPLDLHAEFIQLLADLESQKYRGDVAKQMVETFISKCDQRQAHWYSAIIRKDLKAGFGVDSAIDCGFNIPLFEVQLAKDGKACKKLDQMIKDGLLASRKFDGYRCLAVVEDGTCTLYTRNGEVFHNFPGVEESLLKICGDENRVFDGEIMSTDFNATQKSAFASKRRTTVGDMVFHIFDMIKYDEWVSEKFVQKAFSRYQDLNAFLPAALKADPSVTNLKLIERVPIIDRQHILDLELQYITEGFEGVMANPDIPYYKGKSSNKMLKFKTFKSMDCEVVSAYLGKPEGKYHNTLGGFTVKQENDVLCDVGGGYDDSERDELWEKQDQIIGRVMEVEYQELSKDDQRMRFPVFKRWRPDKDKQ